MQQNAANIIQNKNLKQHNAANKMQIPYKTKTWSSIMQQNAANTIQNKNLKQHNAAKCSKYHTKQKPKAA